MHKLVKIGSIVPKSSKEIKNSKFSIDFGKLDRDAFDPYMAYDKLEECGVKWARIQSGWQRTEKEPGVYDFAWLDDVVDNFKSRNIEPWMCLSYGNQLYSEMAKEVYGAAGCPPIRTQPEKDAWARYIRENTKHFKDRVKYFEIWNEPDGYWCWKHGVNAHELAEFAKITAEAIREVYPEAKIIGGSVCYRKLDFLNTALKDGMGDYIDYLTFHSYTHDERVIFEHVESFRALLDIYCPHVKLIQGESGSQSRHDGHGSLHDGAWTPEIQAKQLTRHAFADLMCDVYFTSFFSSMDMKEALNGVVGDEASYTDFGYFGILGATAFDPKTAKAVDVYKKPAYFALQNLCSVFSEDYEVAKLPVFVRPNWSPDKFCNQPARYDIISGGFKRENGSTAFVYWYPSSIMTSSFSSNLSVEIFTGGKEISLIDIMDGSIYKIPDEFIVDKGDGVIELKQLPIKDTPLVLTIGEFYK